MAVLKGCPGLTAGCPPLAACPSVTAPQERPLGSVLCAKGMCTPDSPINESPCLRCCPGGLQCHLTLFVLAQCQALWDRVRGQERWGKAWALQALAAGAAPGAVSGGLCRQPVQPHPGGVLGISDLMLEGAHAMLLPVALHGTARDML